MAESKWSEVGERIEALAARLKQHFEQVGQTAGVEPLERIKESVTDAFQAAEGAVRDEAVRADVRDTGRVFLEALSDSIAKAAEKLQDKDGKAE